MAFSFNYGQTLHFIARTIDLRLGVLVCGVGWSTFQGATPFYQSVLHAYDDAERYGSVVLPLNHTTMYYLT